MRGRRPPLRPRHPVTRESLPEEAWAEADVVLSERLIALWDHAAQVSRAHATRLRLLAPLWADRDGPSADEVAGEIEDIQAAIALRTTRGRAYRQIRDAHLALAHFPMLFALLEAGSMPAEWFDRVLRRTADLRDDDRHEIDAAIAEWDLGVTPESFHRGLDQLVALCVARAGVAPEAEPERRRRVEILPPGTDGTGCLQIIGPIHEIVSYGRRLDQSARAVQAAQRRAIEDGTAIPYDDGTIGGPRGSRRAFTLARLRYELALHSPLDTAGVVVPADRFRIGLTVPAMTLAGVSEAPGMLDGTIPVPAALAREIAGGQSVWHRILTDPLSGTFLPLPQDRYTPTPAMLEHLRLRSPLCAVPSCTRPAAWASEADHIEEFDHRHHGDGGATAVENLHLLCWQHHLDKTLRRIDPERLEDPVRRVASRDPADGPSSTGSTVGADVAGMSGGHDGATAERGDPLETPSARPSGTPPGGEPPGAGAPAGTSPGSGIPPGVTRWTIGETVVDVVDERDLMTPLIVRVLHGAWSAYCIARGQGRAAGAAAAHDGRSGPGEGAGSEAENGAGHDDSSGMENDSRVGGGACAGDDSGARTGDGSGDNDPGHSSSGNDDGAGEPPF